MNRALSLVLLIVGIALLIFGFNASQSVSSELSKTFSGAPTNKALWLLIAGAACAIFSAVSLGRGPKA